jgi:16S rRNA C967 or C1407 C5-methylase (RsmB/RsmF family)
MTNKLPEDFLNKLNKIYSKEDIEICNNWFNTKKRKPTFRINTLKSEPEKVLKILNDNSLIVTEVSFLKNAFILENWSEKDLWDLEIFEKWYIYMQSISSQIPVNLIEPKEGQRILDITAAPGWKTAQLSEKLKNTWKIIANDNNAIRLEKLNFTLKRQWCKNVEVIKSDARNIKENNPLYIEYFDYIIADLPCSAEWNFNNHREKSFGFWNNTINKKNYRLQKQIMENSIELLKIWWELIYSTCTISPEENEALVHMILCNYPNLELQDIDLNYVNARDWILEYWKQRYKKEIIKTKRILPSEESEWFYIAKFKKVA